VAIKVLPLDEVADAERKRRFVLEAKSASALNHPNIITINDIGSENGLDFIAMEYVPGKASPKKTESRNAGSGSPLAFAYALLQGDHHSRAGVDRLLCDLHLCLDFGPAELHARGARGTPNLAQKVLVPNILEDQFLGLLTRLLWLTRQGDADRGGGVLDLYPVLQLVDRDYVVAGRQLPASYVERERYTRLHGRLSVGANAGEQERQRHEG
jgi:hypothetical protein